MSGVQAPTRAATEKGNERVSLILEAAKTVIVEDGFAGLSYRAIAKKAGITNGNVTYYFPAKDDLMEALAIYIFVRWESRFQKQLSVKNLSHSDVFHYSIRYMIEENKRDKSRALLMDMWAMANHNPSVATMVAVFYERMQDFVAGLLIDFNPQLTRKQRYLRAGLITAQIEGLMILVMPGRPSSKPLQGLEDAAVEQIERLALHS